MPFPMFYYFKLFLVNNTFSSLIFKVYCAYDLSLSGLLDHKFKNIETRVGIWLKIIFRKYNYIIVKPIAVSYYSKL